MRIKHLVNKARQSKLVNDSLWSLGGNVLGKGLALIAGIVVARMLGKDIYGEYGAIRNTILTIGTFSTFGLGYTATKYVAEIRRKRNANIKCFINYANTITTIFSGSMAVLLFIFAKEVSIYVFKVDNLINPLRILAFLIVFNAITNTQIGILSGFGKFKEIAKINTVVGFLTFLFSIVLTYLYSFNGALIALLLTQIINCVMNFQYVKSEKYAMTHSNKIISYKEILKFSTPIAMQESVYSLSNFLCTIILVRFASFGELALYNIVLQWSSLILFMPAILRNVILSHLANSPSEQNFNSIVKKSLVINFISTTIPVLVVIGTSYFIAGTYGKGYEGLIPLLKIGVISTVFTSLSNVFTQIYLSKNKNWIMFIFRIFRDLGIIAFAYLLIVRFQFNGANGLIYSGLFFNVLFLILMSSYYKLKIN